MRRSLLTVLLLASSAFLTNCASSSSSGYFWPESDSESTAPGAAFTADSMHFRKSMPERREPKPWVFYYKDCAMNGDASYFSRTSYDCSGPYY
ncbi:MAG: hypothetical protein AB7F86_06720 [Bdellovibrionales bacterium]